MGLFDSVYADCPTCGTKNEFQSKADEAPYMNNYTVEDAPRHILEDVLNFPHWCAGCQSWFALVDPAFPPFNEPPRPQPKALPVRQPKEGEFSVYAHNPNELRWWKAPFDLSDLAQGTSPGTAETGTGSGA